MKFNANDPAVYSFPSKKEANVFMRNLQNCEYSFGMLVKDGEYFVATLEQAVCLVEECDGYEWAS